MREIEGNVLCSYQSDSLTRLDFPKNGGHSVRFLPIYSLTRTQTARFRQSPPSMTARVCSLVHYDFELAPDRVAAWFPVAAALQHWTHPYTLVVPDISGSTRFHSAPIVDAPRLTVARETVCRNSMTSPSQRIVTFVKKDFKPRKDPKGHLPRKAEVAQPGRAPDVNKTGEAEDRVDGVEPAKSRVQITSSAPILLTSLSYEALSRHA